MRNIVNGQSIAREDRGQEGMLTTNGVWKGGLTQKVRRSIMSIERQADVKYSLYQRPVIPLLPFGTIPRPLGSPLLLYGLLG